MARLKSTKESPAPRMQAWLLGNPKAVVVLGLGTLQSNIFGNRLIRHIAAGRDEVATRPQVPTPELRPQLPVTGEEMMRRLPLNRLHDTARREVWRHTQQQVHMVRPDVALQDLNVLAPTDLPNQVAQLHANITAQHRLAILRDEHEMVVARIHRVAGSAILAHGRPAYRKPPEGVA